MIFNKKADLAISTNAIVVLIIAVIMLGLIIGFVTKGFGLVEKNFLGQVESQEPPAPTASASEPLTLSRTAVVASPGDTIGMKVNIYNPTNAKIAAGQPSVTCANGGADPLIDTTAGTQQVVEKPIDMTGSASFTYLFKLIGGAAAQKYLCQMKVFDGNPHPPEGVTLGTAVAGITPVEFTITVQK